MKITRTAHNVQLNTEDEYGNVRITIIYPKVPTLAMQLQLETNSGELFTNLNSRELKAVIDICKEALDRNGYADKKFFIRQFYNTIPKNKLDILLRETFSVFEDKIITEAQLNEFPIIHKKATEAYYASGGKCKPIDYESTYTGHFTPTSSRENANVYVTDGYWLEVIEVKEG